MKETVFITGASSGIGKATACHFHEKGWNVVATMRTPEKAEELAKLDNVLVLRLDVTDPKTITTAIREGIEWFGGIDVLVNNAGYGAYGPLEAFPRENIVRQFNTNVMGLIDVTRAVLPHFRVNRKGVLINISSVGGKITFPFGSLYHGTKFAVEGITEALLYEMSAFGGKAKIVEPGAIKTDFANRSFDLQNDESITEYQPMLTKLLEAFGPIMEQAAPASACAEVIYRAATDGTNTIRYTAGDDADEWIANRKALDDETFLSGIKKQFGILGLC